MCWGALAAFIAAVDAHAYLTGRPTLSTAFRDGARSHPVAVTATTVYLLAHLYGAIPARADPLRVFVQPRGHRI